MSRQNNVNIASIYLDATYADASPTRMAVFTFRSHFCAIAIFVAASISFPRSAFAEATGCAGTIDPSFVAPYFQKPPQTLITDGDKTITAFDNVIVRFNADGAVDPTFIASVEGPAFYPIVSAIVKDSTDAFVFGGYLEKVNDNARPGLARLLPNGDLDTAFPATNQYFTTRTRVTALATQADGKLLVAGFAYATYFAVRLNADGSLDPTFNPMITDKEILALAVEADGGILAGGLFTYIAQYPRNQLGRVLPNGAVDESFDPARHIYNVGELIVLPDTKILIRTSQTGLVNSTNVAGTNRLARLKKDGSLDFAYPIGDGIHDIAIQRDGKCLAALQYGVVKRFLPNGGEDSTFSADTPATAVALDSRERVIVAGTQYINGLYRPSVARLSNDADPCIPLFRFETDRYTFAESNTVISIPIVRFGDVSTPTSAEVFLSGELLDETLLTNTITFPTGVTRGEARIRLTDNRKLENARTLTLQFGAPAPGSAIGSPSYANIEISDASSYAAPGSGIFEIAPTQLVYENEGAAKITIRRTWSTQGEGRVRLATTDASAHAGEHYIAVDATIIFADGESEKIVEVPLINNPNLALTEVSFNLTLTAEYPASTTWTGSTNSVTIRDAKTGFILLSQPSSFSEKPPYPARVYVRRTGPPNGPASVDVVTDGGTATPGLDYQSVTQRVYFVGGPSNWMEYQSVILNLIDDPVTEAPETIRVVLRNPSPGMSLLDPSTNVFILRDDAEEFRFDKQSITAIQNDHAVQFFIYPVVPQGIARQWTTVHLNYTTEGGTAIPCIEYAPQQGVLTFQPGDQRPQQITIPLLPNSIVGPTTTINLTITPVESEILLTNPVAQVTLLHPTAIFPAGTRDPRFPQLNNYLINTTSNFLYVSGPVPESSTTIGRFRHDGTLDKNFHTDWTNSVTWIRDLPDGGVLLFSYPHTLVRLTPLGAIDPSFKPKLPNLSHFGNAGVTSDGKIILLGYLSITPLSYITQLLPDGSVDSAFNSLYLQDYGESVGDIQLQPDGKIGIMGRFTQIRGVPRDGIARLLPSGELDPSFQAQNPIGTLHWLPEGRFYSIEYDSLVDYLIKKIVRYNADGSLDNTFQYVPVRRLSSSVHVDAFGRFYFYDGRITRTLPNGSPDPDFNISATASNIRTTDHGLLLIRAFYYWTPEITRVFLDPPPVAMRPPQPLANGKIAYTFNFPVGATYALEATSDFLTWTRISSGISQDAYVRIEQDAPKADTLFYRLHSN